jgi:hypothetical protein
MKRRAAWEATAEALIDSFFSANWYGRTTAVEAFENGRSSAANLFPQRGHEILSVSFDKFKRYALTSGVQKNSVRNLERWSK